MKLTTVVGYDQDPLLGKLTTVAGYDQDPFLGKFTTVAGYDPDPVSRIITGFGFDYSQIMIPAKNQP